MVLILKNAHVVDPAAGIDEVIDVKVEDDRIAEVGHGLAHEGAEVRDLSGKYLVPGLVDIHVHFRDPGFEYKEDIETGTRAAAHGGFTAVCTMANTDPVADTGAVLEYVASKAAKVGKCRVFPAGSCSHGLEGEILAEMGDMVAHGAVAFTDDGRGVQNAGMMRRIMDYGKMFDKPIMDHCQDESLVGAGQVNEGIASTRLGLLGWPAAGEEIQIARDVALSELTGCPLHIAHISTAKGLELVKAAKAEGLPVTCEVTPHHLFLSEEDITDAFDTSLKMNPPLRLPSDAEALRRGILDGSVDCVVTDHAPHAQHEKDCEWEIAFFGTIGLETSLPLMLNNMVRTGLMSWQRLVEVMAVNPRSVLRLRPVSIEAGSRADLTLIDPDREVRVTTDYFESLSKNSAFMGETLVGAATDVFVDGRRVLEGGLVA